MGSSSGGVGWPLAIGVAAWLLAAGAPAAVEGQHHGHADRDTVPSEAGTLTAEEVAGLRDGTGMGMALPAELNGYAGPRHVLDLADSLALSPDQRTAVQEVFEQMADRARELGDRIIRMERELDGAFAAGDDPETLEDLVGEIARLRGELRWVHLRAHLDTAEILSLRQRHAYDRLRGHTL